MPRINVVKSAVPVTITNTEYAHASIAINPSLTREAFQLVIRFTFDDYLQAVDCRYQIRN